MAQGDETGGRLIDQLRRNWPARATTSTELVIRLYRLRDLIWSRSQAQARRSGLTWGEFEALAALWSGGAPYRMTPTEISGLMLVTSGGLTKILHGLEAKGLARRVGNDADARSCFMELTKDGTILIDGLTLSLSAETDALINSALSGDEQQRLLHAMEALTCAAERQEG